MWWYCHEYDHMQNAFGVVEASVAVIFKNRKYSHKDMHIDNTRKDEESLMDIQFWD